MILSNKFDYKSKVCLQSDKIISPSIAYIVKMMHNDTFRTPINPLFYEEKIDYKSKILSIGSCFAQNIGQKLKDNRFKTLLNPYGVLYNPVSIFKNLSNALTNKNTFIEKGIITNEEIYRHFDFHSDISAHSENELIDLITKTQKSVKENLENIDYLIITLGTSFVFKKKDSNTIVANCHKIPSKEFEQQLLSVDQIMSAFDQLYNLLSPKCKIIFTVSPIRHFRNGLVDNSLSKSILRYFTHMATEKYQNCYYFPAYEIMIDELRDYRFYKDDMVHPSNLAQEYIWNYFDDAFINQSTLDTRKKLTKVIRGLNHKAFNPTTETHQKFLRKLHQIATSIREIEVTDLINDIDKRIN